MSTSNGGERSERDVVGAKPWPGPEVTVNRSSAGRRPDRRRDHKSDGSEPRHFVLYSTPAGYVVGDCRPRRPDLGRRRFGGGRRPKGSISVDLPACPLATPVSGSG